MKRRSSTIKRRCRNCREEFTPNRPHQVYCTDDCGVAYRNERRAKRVRAALALAEDQRMKEQPYGA